MVRRRLFGLCWAFACNAVCSAGHCSTPGDAFPAPAGLKQGAAPVERFVPRWQLRLLEAVVLPVAIDNSGALVITTEDNRVGLLDGNHVRWWVGIDEATLAAPAIALPGSQIAVVLRDGSYEVRGTADGRLQSCTRLPIRHCANGASISQGADGTLSILCGTQLLHVDRSGYSLSHEVLSIPAPSAVLLGPNLIITDDGKWFRWHRWRGLQPLMNSHTAQLVGTFEDAEHPRLYEQLRSMNVSHHSVSELSVHEFMNAPVRLAEALALTIAIDGSWLALLPDGSIVAYRSGDNQVVGTLGPRSNVTTGRKLDEPVPTLFVSTSRLIAAGWPNQPLRWFAAGASGVVSGTECAGNRQIASIGGRGLLVACNDGLLSAYDDRQHSSDGSASAATGGP